MSGAPQARGSDLWTSRRNASESVAGYAARVVLSIMLDGQARIDEEIAQAANGCGITPDRLRHGRLALWRDGQIMRTGRTRRTWAGGKATEWVIDRRPTVRS